MITRLDYELRQRKSIHLKLYSDTLKALREVLSARELSMQEVLEACADRVASEDPDIMQLLEGIMQGKREGRMRDFKTMDADTLLDVISMNSPLNEHERGDGA